MPTQLGAYDAVGEIVPDLALIDANGNPLSLRSQGDGLIVVSLSTVWCGPCKIYSSIVNDIEAAVQEVRFIDILLEGSVPGVDATTSDAAAWRDQFGVTSPVVTVDGATTLS